ncbi:NAD(P)-dependent dehydrogenase (short-subunit alcohol dehydrogenase family) [Actinomadura pelletieri DSM 43383]|uniref:NAD(P)-dependent dehydrogenase (Short-subunit alcohol dehydrogenase family) n=1 Tax=Actinomadura pelletieri DSM 43383 TaxID=1120940 RepID=A0A495QX93_9ACTN|nr:SDR family NAD(P)-dependent oxidoreductase [Actinomadura pelletieri]RKS78811.1 NAD(P)-dependent dehydrogenase (short-subunit alcohol dehydrogenase family) [Actinomadura pelletieri DSM 43383]
MSGRTSKTVVISGGTDGMGRATALARLARGDTVIVIGSSGEKGRALVEEAARTGAGERFRFLRADMSTVGEVRRVAKEIADRHPVVDALILCANRPSPKRRETSEGLEFTFALYYLSRYLLGDLLRPVMDAASAPLIVNVSGVGNTTGSVQWDDLQLRRKYSMIKAQIQANRANDLLGVSFADRAVGKARYVLYHPGFTRSGDLSPLNPVMRGAIRLLARLKARPVETAIRPIVGWIDEPPSAALSAVDRGKPVDLSLPTLDKQDAERLAKLTEELLPSLGVTRGR